MRLAVLVALLAATCPSACLAGAAAPDAHVPEAVAAPDARTVEDARAVMQHAEAVRWTTVAALLGDGTESCIDGRSDGPVLGTPGGDVGEILAGLAALEQSARHVVAAAHLDALFDAYEASFGKLYLHTDRHAMARLGASLRADPRLAGVPVPVDPEALRAFVVAPPQAAQGPLIDQLTRPEHVGCAHLRFALTEPARYGVRAELVRAVLASTFRLAWRNPNAVDFVMLSGEHRERGVLEIRLDHAVHAHSRVPMIAPHDETHEFFVHHPDVAAFLRRENGTFFLEHGTELVPVAPAEEVYLRELEELAERQSRETLGRVARGLPRVQAVVHEGGVVLGADPHEVVVDKLARGANP